MGTGTDRCYRFRSKKPFYTLGCDMSQVSKHACAACNQSAAAASPRPAIRDHHHRLSRRRWYHGRLNAPLEPQGFLLIKPRRDSSSPLLAQRQHRCNRDVRSTFSRHSQLATGPPPYTILLSRPCIQGWQGFQYFEQGAKGREQGGGGR